LVSRYGAILFDVFGALISLSSYALSIEKGFSVPALLWYSDTQKEEK
jgi:hypothetical protein